MRRFFLITAICTGVLWGGPVGAGEAFDKAYAAYLHGDYAEALDGFRVLAEQGDALVQVVVAYMYSEGKGVPQNFVQAHLWYNLAAAQGDDLAKDARDLLAVKMSPSQIEKAQTLAVEWWYDFPELGVIWESDQLMEEMRNGRRS
jgi:TPR repeat protein